jgi:hypothetical protein
MNQILLVVVTAVVLEIAPVGDAVAQRIVPFVGGGMSIGTGDLSTDSDNGWLAYGGLDIRLGDTPEWSLGGTLGYSHIPYRSGFGEATNATSLVAEVSYLFFATSPAPVRPYLRAGGGMLRQKYDPGNTSYAVTSESTLALSAGGGFDVRIGSASLFVGVHFVGGSGSGLVAVHGGLAYRGFGATTRR